jgi:hypothetical protein
VIYLILYGCTLLLNIGCNQLALAVLGSPQKLLAFLFATGVTMVTNFLGMKFVTFRHIQVRNAECGMRSEIDSPPLRTPHSALPTELTPDP